MTLVDTVRRLRRGAQLETLHLVQGRSPVEGDRARDGGVRGSHTSLLW